MANQNEINNFDVESKHMNDSRKSENALKILQKYAKTEVAYQVIAHFDNSLKMGWLINGELTFSDSMSKLEDKYLQQLRAFNESEEVLIKKIGINTAEKYHYWVRKIDDTFVDDTEYIDSISTIFGKKMSTVIVDSDKLPKDYSFVSVYEPGRKIKLVFPVKNNETESKTFCVTTRSYIGYDDKTGQAGYKYYRYVAIKAERMD